MTQYVKLDAATGSIIFAPKNQGALCNIDKDPQLMQELGYKPLITADKDPDKQYSITYEETKKNIKEIATELDSMDQNQLRIDEIKSELNEIDLKSIRALRANETDRLQILENRAIELRQELQSLTA